VRWKFVPVEQGSTQRLIKSIVSSICRNKKGSKAKSKEIIGKQIKQITRGKLKREPRPGANN